MDQSCNSVLEQSLDFLSLEGQLGYLGIHHHDHLHNCYSLVLCTM